ncbi:MAG: molybdopterin-dependent oxidoreductase, partial [Candidatus Nanoarchaeia archaeon]|nr:molybdopterin oxidoreductase family protein [Candidatus Jingweiarchaeum tengchongense]
VDNCCGRLCHLATVLAVKQTYGTSINPYYMNDLRELDCIFLIGTNPRSNYPVAFNRILDAKKKGAKIISVQSVLNLTSEFADLPVTIAHGTELVLLNGIINFLIKNKFYDKEVESIHGFSELCSTVEKYEPSLVCETCEIDRKTFDEITRMVKESKNFGLMHGMGVTQHVNGIENVFGLLNLVLLKKGKILSLRGEVNVQGAGNMGCLPEFLPIGPMVLYKKLEEIWNYKLSYNKGRSITEALLISPVKVAFITEMNPAQSLPNLNQVHKNLRKMFLVYINPFFNITSTFADVILPCPTIIEETGTITNGEGRIRLVNKVIEPFGESKSVWKIMKELAVKYGHEKYFNYESERQIFNEITQVIKDYEVDADKVYSGEEAFMNKKIRFLRFNPSEFEGVEVVRSKEYPFILVTARSQFHFLTGDITSRCPTLLKMEKEAHCLINSKDAGELGVKDGEFVIVESSSGQIRVKLKIDNRIPDKTIVIPFHFRNVLVNKLMPTQFDEKTFTPNYKVVAVRIRKKEEDYFSIG